MTLNTLEHSLLINGAKLLLIAFLVVSSELAAFSYFTIIPLLILESLYQIGNKLEAGQEEKTSLLEVTENELQKGTYLNMKSQSSQAILNNPKAA